jgi:CheY-like chemotaxis protein
MSVTVLIVEDEAFLRFNAAEIIQDAGFAVMEAANADEAITILEARPDICIVFTDIQMPGSMDRTGCRGGRRQGGGGRATGTDRQA